MATLILSAAGAAVGGPVGGTVGSLLGRQIDRSFGLGLRSRLSDLRAPSSQYGDPIPAVFRRMRVAGVVLWASAPVATATVSKSGTSQGSSVSFAYGLSSGWIEGVGRIWADGKLIWDDEGRQDVSFDMRLYHGDEDQPSDTLIASLLGEDRAPAFRGIAYLLFENFDLSSFGNRLPLITVETVGSGEALIAEDVLRDQLDLRGFASNGSHILEGCAFSGDDVIEALAPLCQAVTPTFSYSGSEWGLGTAPVRHEIDDHLWVLESDRQNAFRVGGRADAPTKVSVRFFDPSIDFQAGEKSARQPGVERLRRIELPAAMDGDYAKAIAYEQLIQAAEEARALWLKLPLSYAEVQVGDEVCAAASTNTSFTVSEKFLKAGQLKLRLRSKPSIIDPIPGDAGGISGARMLERSPLTLALVELPGAMSDVNSEVAVLVSGGHVPFRPLPVMIAIDGEETEIMSAPVASPLGRLVEPLLAAPEAALDLRNLIRVDFAQDPGLSSCDDAALLAGANLLCVDGEFIQFAIAKPLGDASYELSRLIRGRFDSASEAHEIGSSVLLLDPAAMATVTVPHDRIGMSISAQVLGPERTIDNASATVVGLGLRPWAPTHLTIDDTSEGLALSWIRRCKEGAAWLDNVEAPLGSSRELYSISLSDMSNAKIDVQSTEPSVVLSPLMLGHLGPRPWRPEIRQVGDFAAGKPLVHLID